MIPERIDEDYSYIINRVILIILIVLFLFFLFWDSVITGASNVFNVELIFM